MKAFNSRHSENSIYSQQQSPAYWCILVLYEIVSAIHLEILLRGHILPPGDLRHGLHHVADVAVLALKTAGYILGHLKTEGEHVCARLEVFALACLENGGSLCGAFSVHSKMELDSSTFSSDFFFVLYIIRRNSKLNVVHDI